MIVWLFLVLVPVFLLGLWLGLETERDRWRGYGRAGVRVWYLGLLYDLDPGGAGVTEAKVLAARILATRRLGRAARREDKVLPPAR